MDQFDNLYKTGRLIAGHLTNTLSEDEQQELQTWLQESPENHTLFNKSIQQAKLKNDYANFGQTNKELAWAKIVKHTGYHVVKKKTSNWLRMAAAAAVLLFLAGGKYFLVNKNDIAYQFARNNSQDLPPGSNKAVITLASGKKIVVTGAANGLLASEGNTNISVQGHQVVYHAGGAATEMEYNTLTTPRGGQYPLTLADGTHVWLDAESSITYPVAFTGKDRPVKITGQVYFEVAHNAAKPFKVTAGNQTVEVLGTHFNINAYDNEPSFNTTLLEGSIRITANGQQAMLVPGQQAQISHHMLTVKNNADVDEAIAWHKGMFQFHKADIPTVMRQLARWYDVDVVYEGKVSDATYTGKIYRNVTALKMSDFLSYEKIHFRIEGRKIIVMP